MFIKLLLSPQHWTNPFNCPVKESPSKTTIFKLTSAQKISAIALAILPGLFASGLLFAMGSLITFYATTAAFKAGHIREIGKKHLSSSPPPRATSFSTISTISTPKMHPSLRLWLDRDVDIRTNKITIGDAAHCNMDWKTPSILAFGLYDRLDGLQSQDVWRLERHGRNPLANYLSNYYLEDISVEGRPYKSVEHYYQATKFPLDSPVYNQIVHSATADDARRIATANNAQADIKGDQVMARRMKPALWAKFVNARGTPTELGKQLLLTGNQSLIEGNNRGDRSDSRWGAKMDFTHMPNISCEGKNLLGKLLMELRAYCALMPTGQ